MKSPCNGKCKLNEYKICKGCYRSLNEIKFWTYMTEEEQAKVWKRLEKKSETPLDFSKG